MTLGNLLDDIKALIAKNPELIDATVVYRTNDYLIEVDVLSEGGIRIQSTDDFISRDDLEDWKKEFDFETEEDIINALGNIDNVVILD